MTLIHMPREEIAPGKLVSAMLAFIRPVTSVYIFFEAGQGTEDQRVDKN